MSLKKLQAFAYFTETLLLPSNVGYSFFYLALVWLNFQSVFPIVKPENFKTIGIKHQLGIGIWNGWIKKTIF